MKLLFDQNLSHRLAPSLTDLFPFSAHVRFLAMDQASDSVIFQYAKENDFVLVTQDSDFVEKVKLVGWPPKIVWIRCGNATPGLIEILLRKNAPLILELDAPNSDAYVELF